MTDARMADEVAEVVAQPDTVSRRAAADVAEVIVTPANSLVERRMGAEVVEVLARMNQRAGWGIPLR